MVLLEKGKDVVYFEIIVTPGAQKFAGGLGKTTFFKFFDIAIFEMEL